MIESENLLVDIRVNNAEIVSAQLELFEEMPDEPDIVGIKLNINGQIISTKGENFFNALFDLRKELEKSGMLIICNGAAKNVYPSPMQISMGTGRVAYKQIIGQQAKMSDVVDIFACDSSLDFVNVETQFKFHNEWIKSIMD